MSAAPVATDSSLVHAASAGDRTAFGLLVVRYRPMTFALCVRVLGDADAAEDAVQEALLQGLLHLDALRDPGRFGPWLAGIGLNIARRWLRQRAHAPCSLNALLDARAVTEPAAGTPTPDAAAESADVVEFVRRAIGALPRGQAAAVRLYYLAGLTVAETAAQLGVAPNAVKARLFQARAKLERQLLDLWREIDGR